MKIKFVTRKTEREAEAARDLARSEEAYEATKYVTLLTKFTDLLEDLRVITGTDETKLTFNGEYVRFFHYTPDAAYPQMQEDIHTLAEELRRERNEDIHRERVENAKKRLGWED